jgi:late competence protein required for DNA uptake (superfamily II DNA/RNA helicase)
MTGLTQFHHKCERCGKPTHVAEGAFNALIGGFYCRPCDTIITDPRSDKALEMRWNRRRAKQLESTAAE